MLYWPAQESEESRYGGYSENGDAWDFCAVESVNVPGTSLCGEWYLGDALLAIGSPIALGPRGSARTA